MACWGEQDDLLSIPRTHTATASPPDGLFVSLSAGMSDRTGSCRGNLSRPRSDDTAGSSRAARRSPELRTMIVCYAAGPDIPAAAAVLGWRPPPLPATIPTASLASPRRQSRCTLSTPLPAILWQLGKRCHGQQGKQALRIANHAFRNNATGHRAAARSLPHDHCVVCPLRSAPKSSAPVRSVPTTAVAVAVSDDSLSQASGGERKSPASSGSPTSSGYRRSSRGRPNIKATHAAQDPRHERRLPWEVQPATLKSTVGQRRVAGKTTT